MADRTRFVYPHKDRYIKVFHIRKKRLPNSAETTVIKEYIHPVKESIKAYVRQLSAKEILSENMKDTSTYLVVVNYHQDIDMECYIEFKDKILRLITPPDTFEDRNLEMKLTCQIVSEELGYTKVVGKEKLL